MIQVGTIIQFDPSPSSDYATLTIEATTGRAELLCQTLTTVQSLAAAFPSSALPGRCVDVNAFMGQQIRFDIDRRGQLAWIAPVDYDS